MKNTEELSTFEKKKYVKDRGWLEYEGGTWIHTKWIEQRKPYDRMALSLNQAFSYESKKAKRIWRYVDEL
jgi:hypothetical protein